MKSNRSNVAFIVLVSTAVLSVDRSEAAFHLYDFQEVYSNSTGNIQFIELTTTSNSQQFLSGHELWVRDSGNSNMIVAEFVFPGNGPSPTANTTLLLATPDFATTYGIVPDFTIPANFITISANYFLDFDGQDQLNIGSLPTDGVMSLDGVPNAPNDRTSFNINANATPMNFAGATTTIPEVSTAILALGSLVGLFRRRR